MKKYLLAMAFAASSATFASSYQDSLLGTGKIGGQKKVGTAACPGSDQDQGGEQGDQQECDKKGSDQADRNKADQDQADRDQADRDQADRDQGDQDQIESTGTVRWVDYGEYTVSRLYKRIITIDLNGQSVNQINLRAENAPVEIISALAYLSNGEIVDISPVGSRVLAEGYQMRATMGHARSMSVQKIVLKVSATSYRFITSMTKLGVAIGFAE